MHEADDAYSIWSTLSCYWLDKFLTLALDFVEIFNIILDLSITCFSRFSGCWASFMFIVITLSWNAITCFLESSWVWDRFLLLLCHHPVLMTFQDDPCQYINNEIEPIEARSFVLNFSGEWARCMSIEGLSENVDLTDWCILKRLMAKVQNTTSWIQHFALF